MSAETLSEAEAASIERKLADLGALDGVPIHAPNVIIQPWHQSSPKEHWADKEIQKAQEEIESGRANLAPKDDFDGYLNIGQDSVLYRHPRVVESLRRLEAEEMDERATQESLENRQRLWELNAKLRKTDQWDGQGRWIGKDNEEMRIGKILTPFSFIAQLEEAGLGGRVFLPNAAVLKRVGLYTDINDERTRDCDAYDYDTLMEIGGTPNRALLTRGASSLITPDGQTIRIGGRQVFRVATLQYPCSTEWMVMRFDEYGVPTEPKYLGWRTALLAMILRGILTEKEAHKAFPLQSGPASEWYQEQLFMHRNRKIAVNA